MKKLFCNLWIVTSIMGVAHAEKIIEKKTKILGKEFSVKEQLGAVSSGNGVVASTEVKFLGKTLKLLNSKMEFSSEDGKIQNKNNELYVNGIKVWTGEGATQDGVISYSGSVAPTVVVMPVFSYAVGPVVLEVNAGVGFEASMDAKLASPLLKQDALNSTLSSESLVDASLKTNANAKGFVEGMARAFIVQAGVGGNVNIIDGNAAVMANVPIMNPMSSTLSYDGKLKLMNGNVYAFLDSRKIGGWNRVKNFNLYSWNGVCYAMGAQLCVAQ